MRVNWTDRAKTRLYGIEEHIKKDSETAAKNTVEKILRRSWKLAEPPEIGHKVKGYENTILREVMIRPYRILYAVKKTQIDIVTVLHYRQLLPSDLAITFSELQK